LVVLERNKDREIEKKEIEQLKGEMEEMLKGQKIEGAELKRVETENNKLILEKSNCEEEILWLKQALIEMSRKHEAEMDLQKNELSVQSEEKLKKMSEGYEAVISMQESDLLDKNRKIEEVNYKVKYQRDEMLNRIKQLREALAKLQAEFLKYKALIEGSMIDVLKKKREMMMIIMIEIEKTKEKKANECNLHLKPK